MSISKRIREAVDKMVEGDAEAALIPASVAIDATATQVYPIKTNNQAYKDWLHDNVTLITKVGMGNVSIENWNFEYSHPDIRADSQGLCSFEQILYHVVRCGLLHEAKLPENLKFSNEGPIKLEGDTLTLSSSLIYGLIAAVVVSPVNASETIPENYRINVFAKSLPLNQLWGQKQRLLDLIESSEPN